MTPKDKRLRILSMLKQVATRDDLEGVASRLEGDESVHPAAVRELGLDPESARTSIRNLMERDAVDLTDQDMFAAEAIILPEKRPPAFIRNGTYDDFTGDWARLNSPGVRSRLAPVIDAVGRLEMPGVASRPYAGTAFIAGPGLLMTNRHVASLFTSGVGDRGLIYRTGAAAIDFLREVDTPAGDKTRFLEVTKVCMIHPFWDMAILEVNGLPANVPSLRLAAADPEELRGRDVAAIGYPAFDPRNDERVQRTVFSNVFEVKRLQPGLMLARGRRWSFGKFVSAVTHDCSTLGGNSGSAIVDTGTGLVVGLHFSGDYLKANYAVPAYELARDARVLAAGITFSGQLPASTREWEEYWQSGETTTTPTAAIRESKGAKPMEMKNGSSATWIIPIRVTVSMGGVAAAVQAGEAEADVTMTALPGEESFQVPIIFDGLETRAGFNPGFLDLDNGDTVPFDILTAKGKQVAAKLEDGSQELKYHHFSLVMHRTRRLAIYTAANVDWRNESRVIDGHKPTRRELTGLADGVMEQWVTDPRLPDENQIPDVFYTKDRKAFDKGHIVRRDDVAWGSDFEDMQMGNGDTYHTTNCSPQTMQFNQASRGVDNWGDLEDLVQKETVAEKAIVLGGPVLRNDDRPFFGVGEQGPLVIRIPNQFWKIIVVKGDEGPRAYGFMLKQDLSNVKFTEEFVVPQEWKRHMVAISEIEQALRGWADLSFYKQIDQINAEESVAIAGRLQ